MADIAPFRGIRFDTTRVDASKVLAPPYDVIDAAQRAALAASDPHNVVRLILPEVDGGADDGGDRYQAAKIRQVVNSQTLFLRMNGHTNFLTFSRRNSAA